MPDLYELRAFLRRIAFTLRSRPVLFTVTGLMLIVYVTTLLFYFFEPKAIRELLTNVFFSRALLFALAGTAAGIAVVYIFGFLMQYLQSGYSSRQDLAYVLDKQMYHLRELEERIEHQLLRLGESYQKAGAIKPLTEDQRDDLVKALTHQLQSETGTKVLENVQVRLQESLRKDLAKALTHQLESDTVTKLLENLRIRLRESSKKDSQLGDVSTQFSKTFGRLETEIAALTRRGNLNLVLGIMTTVAGLGILAYAVFASKGVSDDPWLLTAYYLPRLSLVIFIQVFAYFFLRLYKSSLAEIKYFQNELTNAELKYIAARLALGSADEGTQGQVIKELSQTERNFILEKGQTTVDLEKERIDHQATRDTIKALSEAVKKSKTIT